MEGGDYKPSVQKKYKVRGEKTQAISNIRCGIKVVFSKAIAREQLPKRCRNKCLGPLFV